MQANRDGGVELLDAPSDIAGPGQGKATQPAEIAPTEIVWPEPAVASFPTPAAEKKRPRRSVAFRFWRDLACGALVVAFLHLFVLQVSVVRGKSMSPSLYDGDRLVVDRVAYSVSEVSRFDVVILSYPVNPSVDFVKRVIGLPGDRVALQNGHVYLDGHELREDFPHRVDPHHAQEFVVPAGHVFVLGDNRPISCDSRSFGMVPLDHLKGKVRCRFWPLGRIAVF